MAMVDTKILLVDDDRDICASVADILLDLGYAVDAAYDGPAALEFTRRSPYGLALLDYRLPGMNGVELYGHIKERWADTVGVLVTAFAANGVLNAAVRAGFRQVIPKPVDVGDLLLLIEEVMGKKSCNEDRRSIAQ
jgi:CheY-like chemotaxis protein